MKNDTILVIAFFLLIAVTVTISIWLIMAGQWLYGILFGVFTFLEGLGGLVGLENKLGKKEQEKEN